MAINHIAIIQYLNNQQSNINEAIPSKVIYEGHPNCSKQFMSILRDFGDNHYDLKIDLITSAPSHFNFFFINFLHSTDVPAV